MEEKKKTGEEISKEKPEPKEQEAIKSLIQLSSGNTSKKKKEKSPGTQVTIDEVIVIPKWDNDKLTYE